MQIAPQLSDLLDYIPRFATRSSGNIGPPGCRSQCVFFKTPTYAKQVKASCSSIQFSESTLTIGSTKTRGTCVNIRHFADNRGALAKLSELRDFAPRLRWRRRIFTFDLLEGSFDVRSGERTSASLRSLLNFRSSRTPVIDVPACINVSHTFRTPPYEGSTHRRNVSLRAKLV